ncbi:phage-like protein [Clostridium botulinum CFSAN001628]|nr:phage-like protein [Clostridium botulinum CFSAN001628]
MGKNAEETKKLKAEYEKLDKQYADSEEKIRNNVRAIENWNVKANNAEAKLKEMKSSLSSVSKEIDKQENSWNKISKKLDSAGNKFKTAGKKMESVGKGITTKVSAPLAGLGAIAVKTTADYDDSMSQLKAITNSSTEDMKKLSDQAKDLGVKTRYSAKEASDSMVMLGQAGYRTTEIMNTMPAVLNLAQAGAIDLTQSTDVLVSSMSQFGIETKNASHVADVLSLGANKANLGVNDMAEALKYAGSMANTAGWSIEETASAIGLMSNYGIKGSQAGTALRGAISRLVKPSEASAEKMEALGIKVFDNNGKMKSLGEVIDEVKKGTSELTEEQKMNTLVTIFGQEAIAGINALMNEGGDSVRKYADELKKSDGSAAKAAQTMEDNIGGAFRSLKSAMEGAAISIGSAAAPAIREITDKITELTRKFSNLSPEMQKGIVKFGAFAIVTGPVIVGIGKLATGFGSILSVGSKVAGIMGKVTLATKGAEVASATAGATMATTGTKAGLLSTAFSGVKGAGGLAASGVVKLAGALGMSVPVLGIAALGVGAVGFGAYKLHQNLKQDAVPAVDLFDKKLKTTKTTVDQYGHKTTVATTKLVNFTKETKKAVGAYMEIDKKASSALTSLVVNSDKFTKQAKDKVLKNFTDMSKKSSKLSNEQKNTMTTNFKKLVTDTGVLTKKNKDEIIKQYSTMVNGTKGLTKKQKDQTIKDFADTLNKSTAITKQQSDDLQKIYKDMGDKIKVGLDKKKTDELKSQQEFFSRSNVLTTTEEAKILQTTATSWENKKKTIDGLQSQINSIIKNAADNHRQITEDEAKTIDGLQKQMKENAVKTLSTSEVEQKAILERLKSYNGRITAEQASDTIKNAEKQRQGAVDKANKQYDGTVKQIIRMRDESKVITADQADKMIKEAERQRKETINKANDQKNQVVSKIKGMNSDITNSVDTSTGKILSKWDKLKQWWANWQPDSKQFSYTLRGSEREAVQKGGKAYATGTTNATRGWNLVGEEGPELLWFDGGETVLNNRDTMNLFNKLDNKIGYNTAKEWGANLSQGLADGISSTRGLVHDSILETANGINFKTRKALGINSPSLVMQELGKFSSEGLALGILENKDKVESAANLAAQIIKDVTENKLDDIQVKTNTDDKEIKDRVARQLNWGVYNKDEYQRYLNFVDKLNKEEVEKSKEFLKEDYENRVKSLDDRLRILKNENSIELQTEKARVDQEIAYYQNLQRNTTDKSAKKNYANQIAALRQYQKQVLNTTKANQKVQVDSLERSKKALEEYYKDGLNLLDKREKEVKKSLKIEENAFKDLMTTYNTAIKSLKVKTGDLVKDLENQEAIVVVQSKRIEDLRKRYEDLAYTLGITASETVKAREEFENARVELENMANAVKDAAKNLEDYIDKFQQDIVNALKQRYEDELKLQEESINTQIQNLEKWKDESIKRIDDVYDAKIKAIEEQLEEEEKADKDAEEMKKINSLKSAIDFEHNQFNKAEMQQELNNLLKEREKRLHKEQLEEQKKKLEKEKEDKLQNINSIYESNKKSLEKQLEDYRSFCEKRTQDAVLQAQAEKMIMDNNQKEIVELLHSYSKEYEYAGQTLGQKLVDGFSPKIQEIKDMIASITAEINEAKQKALDLSRSGVTTNNNSVTNNRNNTFNVYASNNNGGRSIESELRSLTFSMA